MSQRIKPRRAEKVIYQGDDMPRLSELQRAVEIAKRRVAVAEQQTGTGAERLGDETGGAVAVAQADLEAARTALEAFVTEAAARAVPVVVQAIGRRRFTDLIAEHPPRMVDGEPAEDGAVKQVEHPDDVDYGVNMETFPRALLAYREGEHRTIVEPDLSDGELADFVDDDLAQGDFDDLWVAAYWLNRGPSGDPKALVRYTSASRSTPAT